MWLQMLELGEICLFIEAESKRWCQVESCHFFGWSCGGGTVWWYERIRFFLDIIWIFFLKKKLTFNLKFYFYYLI